MSKGLTKSSNAFRNTAWLLFGSIARMLIQLVVGAISARYLGPTNYGVLNYVSAYINLFSIICELGLTISLVNEIVKDEEREGECVGTAIVLRLGAAFISVGLLLIIGIIDSNSNLAFRGVLFIRTLGLLFEAFYSISFWYQAKLQSKYTTIFELVAYLLSSIYKITILALELNIYFFAASTTIDSMLIAIMFLCGYKKHKNKPLKFSWSTAKKLILSGIPFIFSGIMVFIYGQTDRIMIGRMMTQTDVGLYSCAASIGTMIGFIPQAIMNSGKTVIMSAKTLNHQAYEKNVRNTISAVLWTMNLYAVFIILFGKYVIMILYGKAYIGAVSTLNVLIWSYGFSYVGTLRNVWLICEEKKHYATVFSTIGALFNIALNLMLIPVMGIRGAAIATVVTQVITTVVAPFVISSTRRFAVLLLEALILRNVDTKYLKRMILRRIGYVK